MAETELKFMNKQKINIIDTHCHLDDSRYLDDLEEVIQRADEKGIKGILLPGADIFDLPKAKEISYKFNNVFYAAGVHPYHAKDYDKSVIEKYLEDERCIAVGECGLDYYRLPKTDVAEYKSLQKEVFIEQIKLAISHKKPLIVHIRDSSADSLEILKTYAKELVGGVLHCYNASEILLELAEYNFYFGIGGVLTFKNAKKLIEILPKVPKDKLLLETDAPYLTPEPHRGKRNEPSYTVFVAEKMAQLLDISVDELTNLTTKNSINLFNEFSKIIKAS